MNAPTLSPRARVVFDVLRKWAAPYSSDQSVAIEADAIDDGCAAGTVDAGDVRDATVGYSHECFEDMHHAIANALNDYDANHTPEQRRIEAVAEQS